MTPVTAGEVERNAWCPVCLAPTRLRVHLEQAGRPAGVLEICPGCGTGHDRASVAVTPGAGERPTRPRPGNSVAALACRVHRWACRRRGRIAVECAHGDCPWPGLWWHVHRMSGGEGEWSYLFCRPSHRRAWAAGHGLTLS